MDYLIHIGVVICLYVGLALALDLLVGHTGILSVAHAGFFGIGAYACVLFVMRGGVPWSLAFILAIVAGVILSVPVGLPSLRLQGDYFVLTTFAFQMLVFSVLNNWLDLTGGPMGVSAIPRPGLFGLRLDAPWQMLILVTALLMAAYLFLNRLSGSRFGRLLHAIREDEWLARSCGHSTDIAKLKAFAVSSGVAAGAGAVYAHYIGYIDPSSFTIMESILILSMVIIGGAGTRWGAMVGAAALVLLPEMLRFVGLPDGVAARVRQLVYGVLLTVVVVVRPRGLLAGQKGI
jgi:branched-chain amino acid transport system permease protein